MRRAIVASCLAISAASCAAAAPPPKPVVADTPPVEEKVDPGPTSMESEIGGLNEEAMDQAFASLDINGCIAERSEQLAQLGGEVKLRMRIDRRGGARWAYLSSSTLGSREAEKCVLDLVRARRWPKPLGGEGIAEKEFTIDPRAAPVSLDERRARAQVAEARRGARKCRQGVPGSFVATVYVRPDGRVEEAGVAVPSEKGEDVADCVVEAVRKVRFHGASAPAKLSFEIR